MRRGAAPPMHAIPLPRMTGEAMVVEEIALFLVCANVCRARVRA